MFLYSNETKAAGIDYEKERDQFTRIPENSLDEIYIFDANTSFFLNKGALKNMRFLLEEF